MTSLQQSILAGFRTHGPCSVHEAIGQDYGCPPDGVSDAVYDLQRLGFIEQVPSDKFAPQYQIINIERGFRGRQ